MSMFQTCISKHRFVHSFRCQNVAKFVKAILDRDKDTAAKLFLELEQKYPIVITRNITKPKEWLKQKKNKSKRTIRHSCKFKGFATKTVWNICRTKG